MKKMLVRALDFSMAFQVAFSPLAVPPRGAALDPQKAPKNPSASPSKVILKDGTPLTLALCKPVTSASASAGETVDFEVTEELRVGGLLVIPIHGHALGTITKVGSSALLSHPYVGVKVYAVRLVTGEEAALRWSHTYFGKHGKNALVDRGTQVKASVKGSVALDREKLSVSGPPAGVAVLSPAEDLPAVTHALEIISDPGSAEIDIDGRYLTFSQPTTITLPPGEHLLRVWKDSYKPFEMKVETPSGKLTVNVKLQRAAKPEAPPSSFKKPS